MADWLDKYKDIEEAQNGIEGTMGGLTDVGFNYNGAWGGTMQMGGSLPGSVGFMYARTNSPAPSNGPYAKKTKASAENGTEMKFYQEGLDFLPKTISEDGSKITKPKNLKEFLAKEKLKDQWNNTTTGARPKAITMASDKTKVNIPIGTVAGTKGYGYQSIGPFLNQAYSVPESIMQEREAKYTTKDNIKKSLKRADLVTDVMQVGNYIPNPYAQTAGKFGNVLGAAVDALQTGVDLNDENYGNAIVNASSIAIPYLLNEGKYARDMYNTTPGSFADKIASFGTRDGRYIPLTTLPGKATPSTIKGINYNRSLLGALGAETILDSFKEGGVIEDDMGQWNHPGEITKINSNQITMQGVPYPVMGISDTGDTQMMYPGKDYSYNGKSVTEYPMMKNGGWLDKYK